MQTNVSQQNEDKPTVTSTQMRIMEMAAEDSNELENF